MNKVNIGKCKIAASCIAVAILGTNLTGCTTIKEQSTHTNTTPSVSYATSTTIEKTEPVKETPSNTTVDETVSEVLNSTGAEIVIGPSYNINLYDMDFDLSTVIKPGETDVYNSSKNTYNADRRLDNNDYSSYIFNFNEEDYASVVNAISSTEVVYIYTDLYGVEESYAHTGAHLSNAFHNEIFNHEEGITLDELYTQIKMNNESYLKDYPVLYKLSDSVVKEFASYIIEELKLREPYLTEESKQRVYCALGELKVVGIDSADKSVNPSGNIINAILGSDDAVLIDETQISHMSDPLGKEKTFKHEIIHIFQRTCQDQYTPDYKMIGSSIMYDDLEINPEFWNWSYEGASESLVMDEYKTNNALVYKNYVAYIRSLDLALMLKDNADHQAVENSTLNVGNEYFYSLFGVEDENQKKELTNMMYSIDYIQNERKDFEEAYNATGKNILNDYMQVKYEMKSSACATISKYFYLNLAEAIKKGDVSLEDIFYCINVFEADLNVHLRYDEIQEQEIIEANKSFIETYLDIQNNFFEFLSKGYNCSFEEIENLFNSYGLVKQEDGQYKRNAELSWLNEGEKEFIQELNTHNLGSMTTNIRNINIEEQEIKR